MPDCTPSRLVAALALCLFPALTGAGVSEQTPAQATSRSEAPLPPGAVAPVSTLREGLQAAKPIWDEGMKALGYEPVLWLEPGRFFVAPSGFLLARVNSVKTTPVKTFVNVDAGFETLPAEVLVDGDDARVIRRRGTVDDLFRGEVLPAAPKA